MQVSLVKIFLQFSIIMSMLYLYATSFNEAMFRTKRPRYIMRGELRTPSPPEDYCRRGLCPPGVNHIACKNPFWGPQCMKPREGVNMDKLKISITDLFNNLRNLLSKPAYFKNLPRAKPLPKVSWDHELSILAMRITNFCNDDKVSECANTARFLNVGRSSLKSEAVTMSASSFVVHVIRDLWFNHSATVEPTFVTSFPTSASIKDYALANLINKNVMYVGCGMLVQGSGKDKAFYFTCLFNESVKPGQKLYEIV
ncbi:venom allergen 3 [Drosophila innubila]|uniref:venom allergen 3 n=1 Tax=Drosophila innubila TaxID=198719 RepID=UPI00148BA2C3|nr:venom allergen 3 [Drosophila innubila]